MLNAANYAATVVLRDNQRVLIRSFQPEDASGLLAALERVSGPAFYHRFFGPKRRLTDEEIVSFASVDFINHVALVAIVEDHGHPTIVGGGRYIVIDRKRAEVALAVIDKYQGRGVGSALLHQLIRIARNAGLEKFVAEVLPDNPAMLKVFDRSGLHMSKKIEPDSVQVLLDL